MEAIVRPRTARVPAAAVVATAIATMLALAVPVTVSGWRSYAEWRDSPLPDVAPIDVGALYLDRSMVRVTITAAGVKLPHVTTADALRSDSFLWRQMHLDGWNQVPEPLRREGLDVMLQRYRPSLRDPQAWDRMSAGDWDLVPQPMRTVAFRHMAEYWSGYYEVGAAYGIPGRLMADTLSAIAMSESWFEHRAASCGPSGNCDLGLAQASDFARWRLRELHAAGVVDVSFTDAEYFNPWNAARFLAVWMHLLLREASGDLDLAIRAYHRGIAAATDDRATGYLAAVKRRRRRFIRNLDGPAAWQYLWTRDREQTEADWPWLASHRATRVNGPRSPESSAARTPARSRCP